MSYVIINGVDSRTIPGLLICQLPPITKPNKRIKETQIDGVDGSIIEELGYEPYNKTIEIGLTRNYDIDNIIKFFNQNGTIVFSNESDKFYKFNAIAQVDYENLLRFKKASIQLRIQPYKYLLNENYQEFLPDYNNDIPSQNNFFGVHNYGMEDSKPLIYIKGSGSISYIYDSSVIFQYTFNDGDEVYIDCETQDAYFNGELKNRNMIGEFPTLKSGKNSINIIGYILEMKVLANSRWL